MIETTKSKLKKGDTMVEDKKDKTTGVTCSFCGKGEDEIRKVIAGPKVYICDVCVELCNDILAEEYEKNLSGCKESSSSKQVEIKKEG